MPRDPNKKYTSNYISTTKYNLLSFLPLSLILQFKRYANIYFLICAILQSIPLISPLNPASAIAPLCFVLLLSMAREAYEDYKRWQNDKQNNKSSTHVVEGREINHYEWRLIKQGDVIRLVEGEVVPADLLVLLSS